jgi:hypothetical protein
MSEKISELSHKHFRGENVSLQCGAADHGSMLAAAWQLCLAILLSITMSGCGNGLSSVSGRITLDGKPLAGSKSVRVMIMFYPESGTGAPAAAIADESGDYVVSTGSQSGLAPGNYVVTLSATEFTPAADPRGMPTKRVLTPARYANPKESGLRAEVQPGRNTFDFKLHSSAKG